MMKMCNCCDDKKGECGCKHHGVAKMILGVLLLVAAVMQYCMNYGYMGSKLLCGPSTTLWSWILPLVVGLVGIKMLAIGCMKMMWIMKMKKGMGTDMPMDKAMDMNDKKDDMMK